MCYDQRKRDGKIYRGVPQEKGDDPAGAGGPAACDEPGGIQVGKRSFPNKRILRNNLCLPACRILMYKRMALEI